MEETFQNIVDNWFNGNKKDACAMFKGLSSNEQYNFKGWVETQYYESVVPDEFFKMVLFFLIN